jgi:hypothetical protein
LKSFANHELNLTPEVEGIPVSKTRAENMEFPRSRDFGHDEKNEPRLRRSFSKKNKFHKRPFVPRIDGVVVHHHEEQPP